MYIVHCTHWRLHIVDVKNLTLFADLETHKGDIKKPKLVAEIVFHMRDHSVRPPIRISREDALTCCNIIWRRKYKYICDAYVFFWKTVHQIEYYERQDGHGHRLVIKKDEISQKERECLLPRSIEFTNSSISFVTEIR